MLSENSSTSLKSGFEAVFEIAGDVWRPLVVNVTDQAHHQFCTSSSHPHTLYTWLYRTGGRLVICETSALIKSRSIVYHIVYLLSLNLSSQVSMSTSKARLKAIKSAIDANNFEDAATQAKDLCGDDEKNYTSYDYGRLTALHTL